MSGRILRWQELHKIVGKSRSQIWRDERAGLFPRRRQIGKNSVGWLDNEVFEWKEALPLANPQIRKSR